MVVRVVTAERLLSGVEEVLAVDERNGPLLGRGRAGLWLIGGGGHGGIQKNPARGLGLTRRSEQGRKATKIIPCLEPCGEAGKDADKRATTLPGAFRRSRQGRRPYALMIGSTPLKVNGFLAKKAFFRASL